MSYKNDQFFNSGAEDPAKQVAAGNPSFKNDEGTGRSSNVVRFIETDGYNKWVPKTHKLERGYIRSLSSLVQTSASGTAATPVTRCNFQFNPQYINHHVPMRTNLTNLFLQNAAQFSQPVAGDVTFAFQLLFDRSGTLNNEDDNSWSSAAQGTSKESSIGVLADLRALYEVIGQGISESMIDFQRQRAIEMAQTDLLTQQQQGTALQYVDQQGQPTNLPLTDINNELYSVKTMFDPTANRGNTSFLIPMPVRVVFSSLFMVDGYVTETDVTYTKFSSTLVPIQCTVSVSMQAMYVGFAKEQTFLTANLKNAAEALQEAIAQAGEAARQAVDNVLYPSFTKYTVDAGTTAKLRTASGTVRSFDGYWLAGLLLGEGEFLKWVNDNDFSPFVNLTGVNFSYTYVGIDRNTFKHYMTMNFKKDQGDNISALFDQSLGLSILVQPTISIYGKTNNTGFTDAEKNEAKDKAQQLAINSLSQIGGSGTAPTSSLPLILLATVTLDAASANINMKTAWDNFRNGKVEIPANIEYPQTRMTNADMIRNHNNGTENFIVVSKGTVTIRSALPAATVIQFTPQTDIYVPSTDPNKAIRFDMAKVGS